MEHTTRQLLIGNVDNEHMVGEPWRLTYETKCTSSIVANRLTWLLREGDALLIPYPISEDFLTYACSILGIDRASISLIVPLGGIQETQLLTFDVLTSAQVIGQLEQIMGGADDWTVTPYYFDRSVAQLAGLLHMQGDPRLHAYFRQGGAEHFNSKAAFRRMGAGHDIPVPAGFTCSSRAELTLGMRDLLRITGAVIVKQDLNAGGDGNIVVTTTAETVSCGAIETLSVYTDRDVCLQADLLWERLTGPRNTTLVVEAYYPASTSYYSELEIRAGSRRPHLLNFGEMRMDPIWVGFEIPCTLPPYHLGDFLSVSLKLAEIASADGYVGKMNCDAIRTPEGRILFTEVNGRLGGCTHVHVLAQRLLGPHYGNTHTLLTRNKVKTGPSFRALLEMLNHERLLFSAERGRGVVILTEDTQRTGTIEYMVVAPRGEGEAYDLEQHALRLFEKNSSVYHESTQVITSGTRKEG